MSNDNFKSIEELIDNVRRGGEVEFVYNNKQYSITHFGEGQEKQIQVMEFYNYDSLVIYKSANEISEYIIESEKLKDIITKIEVTFRCF
ncbi:hypothetical protein [Ruminiclostridium cellobioparum]|uniref:hypothetical protein n=1 Tax=Ruminiclostridium cellobioparum TaxID=29355 RepID=UPI000553856B|nr:hypothetical protein [Ruminiclostridium cellobioparum]